MLINSIFHQNSLVKVSYDVIICTLVAALIPYAAIVIRCSDEVTNFQALKHDDRIGPRKLTLCVALSYNLWYPRVLRPVAKIFLQISLLTPFWPFSRLYSQSSREIDAPYQFSTGKTLLYPMIAAPPRSQVYPIYL